MIRGSVSDRVLEAMDEIPRELFVPDRVRQMAYQDHPLPIGEGQTISAPHMVAIMCDVLDLGEGMKVLDVGTGSGYHAAVMAKLVGPGGHVYSIERVGTLVAFARKNLLEAGIENVTVFGVISRQITYNASIDILSNPAGDWPVLKWGVEFPVEMGNMDDCANPQRP